MTLPLHTARHAKAVDRCAIRLPRITALLLACLLPACAYRGLSLPRGVYLQNCSYGVLAQSQPARCLTRTEYMAEKEKARHALEDAAREGGRPMDPRYKDWIPGTSADPPSDARTPADREKDP